MEDGGVGQESAPPDEDGASKRDRGDSVRNRQDALRLVLRTAEFFKRTEPHSPIAYLLEQAVRWGSMSLPDLWAELMPEETQRARRSKLAGIRPPERQEQKPRGNEYTYALPGRSTPQTIIEEVFANGEQQYPRQAEAGPQAPRAHQV